PHRRRVRGTARRGTQLDAPEFIAAMANDAAQDDGDVLARARLRRATQARRRPDLNAVHVLKRILGRRWWRGWRGMATVSSDVTPIEEALGNARHAVVHHPGVNPHAKGSGGPGISTAPQADERRPDAR